MLKHRVIPCLLLRNGGLVKTLKFGSPKYVGDPINAIKIFNDKINIFISTNCIFYLTYH